MIFIHVMNCNQKFLAAFLVRRGLCERDFEWADGAMILTRPFLYAADSDTPSALDVLRTAVASSNFISTAPDGAVAATWNFSVTSRVLDLARGMRFGLKTRIP